jgi:drug/metabolite transporter (DMT)-like permease
MIAAVGFTFQSGLEPSILGFSFPAGVLLIIASMLAWYAFYFIDRFGYHSLLKGAVSHAGKIENEYKDKIPGIGLGNSISEASQSVKFFGFKADSNTRLKIFYLAGGIMLGILLVGFMFATKSVAINDASKLPPPTITENE